MGAPDEGFAVYYRYLAAAQKSSVGVSHYSRWVNRPWGRVLASACRVVGLSPNQVTAISGLTSLAGLVLLVLVPPHPLVGVAVGFLLMLGFAFDSADGQLARLRGGGSPLGEWLDHIVDSAKTPLVHLAVAVAAWRFYDLDPLWLVVPLGFTVVGVVLYTGTLLTPFLLARKPSQEEPRRPSTLRSLLLLPADYGVLATSFLLTGVPAVFVPVYTLLGIATALITVALLVSWMRRLG